MATTRKRKYTPEQQAAYRDEQRAKQTELLHTAATELMTSDGWQRWVRFRSRMNRYSANNIMLIVSQCPEATFVAKYPDWQELGRNVIPGETALRIFAPLFRWPTPEEIAAGHPADRKVRYAFKLVPVFDVSQTEGAELPVLDTQPIEGDSHEWCIAPLTRLALELGYTVETKPVSELHGAGGYCDTKRKRIVVADGTHANAAVRVLVHEVAHALGIDYKTHTREQAETLVECVTYIVLAGVGLDTGSESVAYVAGWAETADGLAAITKFAGDVDRVARRIEDALQPA